VPTLNPPSIDDAAETDTESGVPRAAKKILIVDDDVVTARALQVILRDAGYDAHSCHGGTAALHAARKDPPHAALIDIHLPDLNGLILAQQLRQLLGPDTPIIICSGDTSMETLNSLPHVGATFFFSKPLNRNALVERMKEWVP